jgi:hypothetical protein
LGIPFPLSIDPSQFVFDDFNPTTNAQNHIFQFQSKIVDIFQIVCNFPLFQENFSSTTQLEEALGKNNIKNN